MSPFGLVAYCREYEVVLAGPFSYGARCPLASAETRLKKKKKNIKATARATLLHQALVVVLKRSFFFSLTSVLDVVWQMGCSEEEFGGHSCVAALVKAKVPGPRGQLMIVLVVVACGESEEAFGAKHHTAGVLISQSLNSLYSYYRDYMATMAVSQIHGRIR